MSGKKTIWIFIFVVIVLPVAAFGVYRLWQKKFSGLPVYGSVKKDAKGNVADHTVPGFSFTNQLGETVTIGKWENKIVVVDYFFTRCPSICPKMTNNLKLVQQSFSGDEEVAITSFTVDPEGDSTAALKKFANRFGIDDANWDLLTGDKMQLYKLARNGFMIVATDGDGGPDDFIHSEKLVLIDKKKRIRGYYNGTDEKQVKQLIIDIKKLKHEN